MSYRIIEHTADTGIIACAPSRKKLFINTAKALFDIMAKPRTTQENKNITSKIKIQARNLEELLVKWLNQLLFLSETKKVIFTEIKIIALSRTSLSALLLGKSFRNFLVATGVKAATYHRLRVQRKKGLWQALVILDV